MILGLCASAWAGGVTGDVSLDSFVAHSTNEEPASGSPQGLTAAELGMRLRLELDEADGRLKAKLDYRGREPLPTDLENGTQRLLYRADVRFEVVEDRLELGAGRFIAPAAVWLPTDGLTATWRADKGTEVVLFGGRRAITTSRAAVPLSEFLPAAGLAARRVRPSLILDANLTFAADQAVFATGLESFQEEYSALSGLAHALVLPTEDLRVGARLGFAQQASYLLGPTWADATVVSEAVDLSQALIYSSWDPADWARLDLDLHHQQVGAYRLGTIEGGATVEDEVQEPNHSDVRLRAAVSPLALGWVRLDSRLRLRPDRSELRLGTRLQARELGVRGLRVDGSVYFDNLFGGSDDVGVVDRLFWSASAGWSGAGLDVDLGTSFIERAATPVSGRVGSRGAPTDNVDLAPFVLEANNIAFLRAFYSGRRWFVGADAEKNLLDSEVRVLVQVGVLAEVGW